ERRARRADRVHQAGVHEHLGLDARGEMLAVYVAELGEDLRLALVQRIELPEPRAQLLVGVLREVHFPDALVVAEKRKDRCGALDARLERGAGEGEPAALRAA